MALWLGSLVGMDHKGSQRVEAAEDKATASATIAVMATERLDSLEMTLARTLARVRVLERAAGKDKLADARESIARPNVRKPAKPFWRFW
jgi:hypothetical protein